MGFNKIRQWIKEEIFTIIIESPELVDGKKPRERWTVTKRDFKKLLNDIDTKYGLGIWERKKDEKQLDWALNH